MAWIESHQSLHRHPKLTVLSQSLGVSPVVCIGHLHVFWWWCIDYAPSGELFRYQNRQIAQAADWTGDADAFVHALVESGFLDSSKHGLSVHDWLDFCGELVKQRCRRMKEKRGEMKNKSRQIPPNHRHPKIGRAHV